MNKKIGILTINDYSNYGNRLQNYALQKVIEDLECDVETIVQERSSLSGKSSKKNIDKIISLIRVSNKEKLELIMSKIKGRINNKYRINKIENLRKFTSLYINEASSKIAINNISDLLASEYDYFITGSDQVWNPSFGFGNEIDFIEFAPKYKRISYAASFGISILPEKNVEDFRKKLINMDKISVREEAGAEIVRHLTGKKPPVLVDPTLLIDKDRWKAIMTEHIYKPKKKYLLTYMLGDVEESSINYIKKLSQENNLDVVNLCSFKDRDRYDASPTEFIDYFNSAEIVVTNSFHGAVFSILLEKAFIVMGRDGLNSRIDTLLNKFKLESRKIENVMKYNSAFQIDFSHVQEILENERQKAMDYLKNALKIEDAN